MNLPRRLRTLLLTVHITVSVGWLGAIAGFLAMAILGVTSRDAQLVRAVYLVMEPLGWIVLVPLSLAALLTGVVQALGTPWGLLRHYWVLFKFLINLFAVLVLLLYMPTLRHLGERAADSAVPLDQVRSISPVIHAGAALLLVLVATVLSVFKPRGVTPYGRRRKGRRQTVLP